MARTLLCQPAGALFSCWCILTSSFLLEFAPLLYEALIARLVSCVVFLSIWQLHLSRNFRVLTVCLQPYPNQFLTTTLPGLTNEVKDLDTMKQVFLTALTTAAVRCSFV